LRPTSTVQWEGRKSFSEDFRIFNATTTGTKSYPNGEETTLPRGGYDTAHQGRLENREYMDGNAGIFYNGNGREG